MPPDPSVRSPSPPSAATPARNTPAPSSFLPPPPRRPPEDSTIPASIRPDSFSRTSPGTVRRWPTPTPFHQTASSAPPGGTPPRPSASRGTAAPVRFPFPPLPPASPNRSRQIDSSRRASPWSSPLRPHLSYAASASSHRPAAAASAPAFRRSPGETASSSPASRPAPATLPPHPQQKTGQRPRQRALPGKRHQRSRPHEPQHPGHREPPIAPPPPHPKATRPAKTSRAATAADSPKSAPKPSRPAWSPSPPRRGRRKATARPATPNTPKEPSQPPTPPPLSPQTIFPLSVPSFSRISSRATHRFQAMRSGGVRPRAWKAFFAALGMASICQPPPAFVTRTSQR